MNHLIWFLAGIGFVVVAGMAALLFQEALHALISNSKLRVAIALLIVSALCFGFYRHGYGRGYEQASADIEVKR